MRDRYEAFFPDLAGIVVHFLVLFAIAQFSDMRIGYPEHKNSTKINVDLQDVLRDIETITSSAKLSDGASAELEDAIREIEKMASSPESFNLENVDFVQLMQDIENFKSRASSTTTAAVEEQQLIRDIEKLRSQLREQLAS
tara:strand:- start:132 stop:554 length:423 start_codon:yes stop_codon:yes gene_type:complete